jgi:hypothetical protein
MLAEKKGLDAAGEDELMKEIELMEKWGELQAMYRNCFGTAQGEKDSRTVFAAKSAARESVEGSSLGRIENSRKPISSKYNRVQSA